VVNIVKLRSSDGPSRMTFEMNEGTVVHVVDDDASVRAEGQRRPRTISSRAHRFIVRVLWGVSHIVGGWASRNAPAAQTPFSKVCRYLPRFTWCEARSRAISRVSVSGISSIPLRGQPCLIARLSWLSAFRRSRASGRRLPARLSPCAGLRHHGVVLERLSWHGTTSSGASRDA
jgi:hypothetical protein